MDAVVAVHLPHVDSGRVSLHMSKAKLTDAEYNVMACFWHEELDCGFVLVQRNVEFGRAGVSELRVD